MPRSIAAMPLLVVGLDDVAAAPVVHDREHDRDQQRHEDRDDGDEYGNDVFVHGRPPGWMQVICASRPQGCIGRDATLRPARAYKAPWTTGSNDHLAAGRHARAFDLVVPAYRDRVFRLAYSILQDRAAAEDAAQETFVRVWKALPGFDGRAALGTWIYAITRNTCLMELRRRRPHRVVRRPGLDRGPARRREHRDGPGRTTRSATTCCGWSRPCRATSRKPCACSISRIDPTTRWPSSSACRSAPSRTCCTGRASD